MIPEVVGILFMVIPWLCFLYMFRGMSSQDNPIWGNILAAGMSALVSAMVALWFISGTIVSPTLVSNASYTLPADLSGEDFAVQFAAASNTSNHLGASGSGMFLRSAVIASSGNTNETTATVFSYDIVYAQYSDVGIMMLYMALCVISVALFLWFLADLRKALMAQDAEDEFSGGVE